MVLVAFIAYWLYNRKRYHDLSHQIPASVVKNYLDSIIQNSSALKSSLFRGGGSDVGSGIPSVMPVQNLAVGHITADQVTIQELNQKRAELAAVQSLLADKDATIRDLERKLKDLQNAKSASASEETKSLRLELDDAKKKLTSAESSLAAVKNSSGDEVLKKEIAVVTKERDELKERLMEYGIIEEDLANLKKLQQENESLKKALADAGGTLVVADAVVPPAAIKPAPEPVAPEEDLEAAMAAAIQDSKSTKLAAPAAAPALDPAPPPDGSCQKSADDLLSEFEKMLG